MIRLLILVDYRGAFWSTIRNVKTFCSMAVDRLREEFEKLGFGVDLRSFSEVDLRSHNYGNYAVVYQSSEDRGLLYKGYIEDVLLALELNGAVLVPGFQFFRAHHNKVFWELLRDSCTCEELKTIRSHCCGVLEELRPEMLTYPAVIKGSWGAGGNGVHLAHNTREARRICEQISRSADWRETLGERRLRTGTAGYVKRSLHRRKFVVQNLVRGLTHDYKVLAYPEKYYVVRRENRPGDFRASGSGRLSWPEEPPTGLLDFAKRAFSAFDVPVMSMDIGFDKAAFHLLEAQFVSFGPKALEESGHHFVDEGGAWKRVDGPSVPEVEFARCVAAYVRRMRGKVNGLGGMRNGNRS